VKLKICVVLFLLGFQLQTLRADETVAGYHKAEALNLGQKMYREGILPSGKPINAMVMGDTPVDGRMFICSNCHQRSGLGSREGTVITWPINGRELSSPRRRTGAYRPQQENSKEPSTRQRLPEYFNIADIRPPYTPETLARVIRTGIDSAGNHISKVMPRFDLDDTGMAILIHYLQNLSTTISPGVDGTTIQFATVIGSDVSETDKTAMLSVLQAHIDAHNSQTRNEERRATAGPFFHSEKNQSYRRLNLHIWQLQGPQSTWRSQLEQYYREQPVFAFLGGISNGQWQEVHSFCEENKIPNIFPITDLPLISNTDWYTLYFAKGQYQEGESAARYLRNVMAKKKKLTIVQIYNPDDEHGRTLAAGFSTTWKKLTNEDVSDIPLNKQDTFTSTLNTIFSSSPEVALLVWLDDTHGESYRLLADYINKSTVAFASATILHENFARIPDTVREKMLFTYPYSSNRDEAKSRIVVERWLANQDIPLVDFNIQAKMYFLGWMLPGALKSMRSEYFRDYFMERFDMMPDQNYAIAVYPRLSFGPGQRYAAKRGCYIMKLRNTPGDSQKEILSDWMIY
jgi:hypothetical protein